MEILVARVLSVLLPLVLFMVLGKGRVMAMRKVMMRVP